LQNGFGAHAPGSLNLFCPEPRVKPNAFTQNHDPNLDPIFWPWLFLSFFTVYFSSVNKMLAKKQTSS
jgi:hypothetical protein